MCNGLLRKRIMAKTNQNFPINLPKDLFLKKSIKVHEWRHLNTKPSTEQKMHVFERFKKKQEQCLFLLFLNSLSIPPGTKISLTGTITVKENLLMLDSNNTKVLGGEVEKLKEKWELNKVRINLLWLCRVLNWYTVYCNQPADYDTFQFILTPSLKKKCLTITLQCRTISRDIKMCKKGNNETQSLHTLYVFWVESCILNNLYTQFCIKNLLILILNFYVEGAACFYLYFVPIFLCTNQKWLNILGKVSFLLFLLTS